MKEIKQNKPLAQIAADHITDYILENDLKGGDKLPSESELMSALNVGRGTIREAIKILVSNHVVEIRRGIGTFVCENMGVSDDPLGFKYMEDKNKLLMDSLELRLIIEPSIAAKAATQASNHQIEELERLCQLIEERIHEGKDYLEEDMHFHSKIAESSNNLVVSNLLPIIHGSIEMLIKTNKKALVKETIVTHRKITLAIKNHDEKAAYEAMQEHLLLNRDFFLNHVND